MRQLPAVDVGVLIVYLALVVAFGCWFVRRSRTTEGFMVAGRSLPGWAVGLSIFGTYLSSNTFLGVPGKAFGANWNSFVFSLSLPIAAWIAMKYFVPFYRRGGGISAYEHLERRFGGWARVFADVCYLLTQIVRIGTIMLGVALGLHALLGWDMAAIIVCTGAVVTLYTMVGGIEAVIWTDVAQSVVLSIGAVAVTLMLLFGMPGGAAEIVSAGFEQGKFSLGSFGPSLTEPTFWVVLTYGVVMNLNNFGIDQSFVQRYHAARSDRAAAGSVWFGALLYVPVSLVFFFIGTALFVYYQDANNARMLDEVKTQVARERLDRQLADDATAISPAEYDARLERTAAALKPDEYGDAVLPHFIVNRLPVGMAGLLIAAIFAAAMSSIDTSLNSSATIILTDVYRRYFRPDAGQRESMAVLYGTTLLWGALGTGTAVSLIGVDSILDAWWILSGTFVGGMLGLFLLGLIARFAGNAAAVSGVMAGTAVILWMSLSTTDWWPEAQHFMRSPLHKFLIPVVGTTTIVLVGLWVGILGSKMGSRRNGAE